MFDFEPSWIHAFTVHTPLVLLPVAIAFAAATLLLPRTNLRLVAFILLFMGFAGAILAKETGENAAHNVHEGAIDAHNIVIDSSIAESVADGKLLRTHALFAEWTRNLYGALFLIEGALLTTHTRRFTRWRLAPRLETSVRVVWLLIALAGIALIILTGHFGGLLVYEYGVGTK